MPEEQRFNGPLEIFGSTDDVTQSGSRPGVQDGNPSGVTQPDQTRPHEQNVPYERLQEVIRQRDELMRQRDEDLKRLLTLQQTQAGVDANTANARAEAQIQQQRFQMDESFKEQLANDLAVDPGAAAERLMQRFEEYNAKILEQREQQLLQRIEQQYNPVVQQFQQSYGTQLADRYFQTLAQQNPNLAPLAGPYQQAVQQLAQTNPQLIANEQGLQQVLYFVAGQAALGAQQQPVGGAQAHNPYAQLQGQQQAVQFQQPFSEPAGFGAQPQFSFQPGQGQRPPVPASVLARGRAMGLSDEKISQTYYGMLNTGSFGD